MPTMDDAPEASNKKVKLNEKETVKQIESERQTSSLEEAFLAATTSTSGSHPTTNDSTATRADGKKRVEKGSLNLQELVEAKERAKTGKSKCQMTEQEKKAERRAANRLSAFQSRQRKKNIIEDLQKTVAQLSHDNASLKMQLETKINECNLLRTQLAATTAAAATNTSSAPPGTASAATTTTTTTITPTSTAASTQAPNFLQQQQQQPWLALMSLLLRQSQQPQQHIPSTQPQAAPSNNTVELLTLLTELVGIQRQLGHATAAASTTTTTAVTAPATTAVASSSSTATRVLEPAVAPTPITAGPAPVTLESSLVIAQPSSDPSDHAEDTHGQAST